MSAAPSHPCPHPRPAGRSLSRTPASQVSLPREVPEVSPATLAVLRRGIHEDRLVFPESGGWRRLERWVAPGLDPQELAQVQADLEQLEQALRPATRHQIGGRILALLAHYPMDPKPPELEQAAAQDWMEDLEEFPFWAIEEACRTWRRQQKFRPRICEIRELAIAAVGHRRTLAARLRACLDKAEISTPRGNAARRQVSMLAGTWRSSLGED